MSHLLWKHFWDDDVDKFRRLLGPTGYTAQAVSRSPNIGSGGGGGTPGAFATSPRTAIRSRKGPGFPAAGGAIRHGSAALGRSEVNSRDHAGLTVLLRAASSTSENAVAFVKALLEHPALDLYAQDPESGWNALHRALYTGNISIARLLLEKERKGTTGQTLGTTAGKVGQLIKTKDHEGKSPFDLYNSTIAVRDLKALHDDDKSDDSSENENMSASVDDLFSPPDMVTTIAGDELFTFGSNKNLSLGLGDEDDRHFPERVYLKRPGHLLQRFYAEHLEKSGLDAASSDLDLDKIPATILNRPIWIHDVVLSKFHSAVLTTDPVSNLYICGIGRGGRLGLGDENTRFSFVPVQGGLTDERVVQVALGQNHSMAVTATGELWTWGSNAHSQLGYALPAPAKKDEEPCTATPRQVFGPLRKEVIAGIAASSIHSVAHTASSLYCWGKNLGQLALMDADSRSLEVQPIPRRVAAALLNAPIVMVSAIDKATTCLLANHTVCVFTGYGYNIVKFPFPETMGSFRLGNVSMSSRYEPGRTEIQSVCSGGETIAALTGRGDLFTMSLNHRMDANPTATSTTNPSKIKGAVTQPQCIWHARQDGVRCVSVSEHGSVIIRTESGAVWRRVKRTKATDASVSGLIEAKRKDYKFQRVPYVTRVVTVRSSAFGAFAAIRRDSDVMRTQISVDPPTLWDDVQSLCCLDGFKASEPANDEQDTLKFWKSDALQDRLGAIAYEVLKSTNLEADLSSHLATLSHRGVEFDAVVCTTANPELLVPVHGWALAARSPVLREGLKQFRRDGSSSILDLAKMEQVDGRLQVSFSGLDIVSLLNLVLYMYTDRVIPAWNFTRQAPALAYRYRQIRSELMRAATHLKMSELEAAVRVQTAPKKTMADDFRTAIRDRAFFEDGDVLAELDDGEVPVHSALLCQRCPWFEGLFHGRSGGLWLAGRRQGSEDAERVNIDLKHIEPRVFRYVIEHVYADSGPEMFDTTVVPDFDDFIDLVMDVLNVANELMLDRLSQICQQVIGRYVNTRSIAHLLNAIGPCSVTEFKDAGLEYICLQMESMLENHMLDELDEDLLLELDEVVRGNQLALFPFARSSRAELLMHEKYPELVEEISEERQRRVKEMVFKALLRDDERKLSSSFRGKVGSLDELGMSPTQERTRRSSRHARNEPFSPDLRPKDTQVDLMFDMEEEGGVSSMLSSPLVPPQSPRNTGVIPDVSLSPALAEPWNDGKDKTSTLPAHSSLASPRLPIQTPPMRTPPQPSSEAPSPGPSKATSPWGHSALPTSKLDLRQIMSESTAPATSALSTELAAQRAKDTVGRQTPAKVSQKERKKQQQQQLQASQPPPSKTESPPAWETVPSTSRPSPWQKTPSGPQTSLKDIMTAATVTPRAAPTKPLVAAEASAKSIPRRTASPDTRFSGQSRTPNTASATATAAGPSRYAVKPSGSTPSRPPLVPHSKSYLPPRSKAEPSLGFSMDDIIGQQKREREAVQEAVAKRSLQEIQQEQAFQEWWDQESRRAQEEEARRVAGRERDKDKDVKNKGKAHSRRGRPGKPKGGETRAEAGSAGGVAASSSKEQENARGRR